MRKIHREMGEETLVERWKVRWVMARAEIGRGVGGEQRGQKGFLDVLFESELGGLSMRQSRWRRTIVESKNANSLRWQQ